MIRILILAGLVSSCATSIVKFKAKETVTLRLVEKSGQISEEVLGTTPFVISGSKLLGKGVRVEAPRKRPEHWFFVPTEAHETEILLDLDADPYFDKDREELLEKTKSKDKEGELARLKGESAAQKNRFLRTLLAAYQALSRDEADEALRLASEAASLQSDVAAPEIIRGLALLKLKKLEAAKLAFRKAKVLDPADPNIEVLLKSLED